MAADRELGLEALVKVRSELDADVDNKLLEACFQIQKKYQFSHDRTLSTQAMDRLIDDYVGKVSGKATKDGA